MNSTTVIGKPYDYAVSDRPEVAALLLPGHHRVLEIGCAKGGFRTSLEPAAEVWGIEPNAAAAEQAARRGYRMLVGTFEAVAPQCPDAHFDLVVCNDVIEDIADHDRFLEDIKVKVAPGGHIVGSVPNVRYFGNVFKLLALKDWRYEEQGILDRTHLRFFTEKSLARTFADHGWRIERLVGINSDFSREWTSRQTAKNLLLAALIAATLGQCRDFRFLQFAFRLRLDR
jgi:2-polyprenyl-3-methyl-5-hydroxy-6-metoxy-1,4-benzoquinol methylase